MYSEVEGPGWSEVGIGNGAGGALEDTLGLGAKVV